MRYNKNMIIEEFEYHIKQKHYAYGFNEESRNNYKDYFDCFLRIFKIDLQKPQIVDGKKFKEYGGEIVYRGYDVSILKFIKLKNEFLFGDYQRYHKLTNNFGAGLYFLDSEKVVKDDFYGDNIFKKGFNTTILSTKIDKSKIINVYDLDVLFKSKKEFLLALFKSKLKNCEDNEIEEFINFLSKSNQYIFKALLLGFDGIQYEMHGRDKSGNEEICNAYVVYNRKCLVVKKKVNHRKENITTSKDGSFEEKNL